MHMNEQIERLIQRCVDDELSSGQMQLLLSRLDTVDAGWKTLAGGFLEDRLLRNSIGIVGKSSTTDRPDAVAPVRVDRPELQTPKVRHRHWFSHSLTSVALCTAIAFVAGLLIPRSFSPATASVSGTANSPAVTNRITGTHPLGTMVPLKNDAKVVPLYHVEWVPDERSNQQSVQIPVCRTVDDWAHELAEDRQLFPNSVGRKRAEESPETRLIRLPLNDSEDILLLVRDENLGFPVQ